MYTLMYLFYLFCMTKHTNKTQQQITTDHLFASQRRRGRNGTVFLDAKGHKRPIKLKTISAGFSVRIILELEVRC